MNILLTSVGRRAYLVKYFKEALNGEGEVHVSNSDDLTVAFSYADKRTVSPLIYSEQYIPFLLNYCQQNSIDVMLSLFDIDLYVLAKHKAAFAAIGTRVIVSEPEWIEVCNDKWKTYLFLKENGFNVPKTYLTLSEVKNAIKKGEVQYPIMVKARFGCGSIAISIAEDEESIDYCFKKTEKAVAKSYLKYESSAVEEKVIFQEFLKGQEHGVDVINDLEGNFVNAIVKKKIAMRSGETDIAETISQYEIKTMAERLGKLTGHIGNMDVDVFLVNGVPYILEMNARFGGGYPFSHIAGCNLPLAIVKWCRGEKVDKELVCAKEDIRAYKEIVLMQERVK